MELLILQFNNQTFTEAQAKQVLSICFEYAWPMLKQKFICEDGLYWNERLKFEIDRRRIYSESRRNNGLQKKNYSKKPKKHMLKHMENENENENIVISSSFSSDFLKVWNELLIMPKWKKKPKEAIRKSLSQLEKYDEAFAIGLVEKAIAGNYQGVTFSSTETEYSNFKQKPNGKTISIDSIRNDSQSIASSVKVARY